VELRSLMLASPSDARNGIRPQERGRQPVVPDPSTPSATIIMLCTRRVRPQHATSEVDGLSLCQNPSLLAWADGSYTFLIRVCAKAQPACYPWDTLRPDKTWVNPSDLLSAVYSHLAVFRCSLAFNTAQPIQCWYSDKPI
jgi:hypothetical protein